MSRILILTSGTRGDVDPYVVLATSLAGLGHRVEIAAHRAHTRLASAAGHPCHPLGANPSDHLVTLSRETAARGVVGRAAAHLRYLRRAREAYVGLADTALSLIRPTDTVILGLPTIWLYPVAREAGARVVVCPLQPLTPTAAHATALLTASRRLPRPLHALSHHAAISAVSLPWAARLNRWAKGRRLGWRFSPLGPLGALLRDGVPFVYGVSGLVYPRPADWPVHHRLGGFWLSEQARPPSGAEGVRVAAFLDTPGPPVVFVDFGSLEYLYGQLVARLARAIEATGCRALIHTAAARPGGDAPPAAGVLYASGPLPHDWVLARVAAMVHHGGAGTFARAARAGVPSLPVAAAADGGFWARRARAIGVSPAVVGVDTAHDVLVRAIRALVGSRALRARAAALGAALRVETGTGGAAALIHAIVNTRGP